MENLPMMENLLNYKEQELYNYLVHASYILTEDFSSGVRVYNKFKLHPELIETWYVDNVYDTMAKLGYNSPKGLAYILRLAAFIKRTQDQEVANRRLLEISQKEWMMEGEL